MRAPDQPRQGTGLASAVRLAAWIVAVQLAFWGFAFLLRPPLADPIFERNEIANLQLVGADGQLREAYGRPDYYLGETRSARFVGSITLAQPEAGLVVFAPRYNRRASLFVNGEPVPLSDAPAWRGGRLGAKWVVPPALLAQGSNALAVDIERECCSAYLSGLIAAPPGEIDLAIRKWRMQALVPAFGLMVLGLFGAGSCLLVVGNRAYRSEALAAALAFVGMALGGFWQADILTSSSEPLYNAAGHMALLATFTGLVALADRWFPGGPRHDRWLLVIVPPIFIVVAAGAFPQDGLPAFLRSGVEIAIIAFANLAVLASIARGLMAERARWTPDAAVFLLVPTISIADLIDSLERDPLTLSAAPLGVLGLALLLLLGIVRRGRILSQRLENANALLEARIAAKQAELEGTAALLRQREAEAAVQGERARIMRDMHDGMGGQLLAVLMLSRDETSPRGAITETVETAIEDLRLLIDSLDSVGDTIDIALGQFRERAETKLRAAGMELVWSNRLGSGSLALPPGTILALYRIMQEAINNAVRHSGGRTVRIAIAPYGASGLALAIADDGQPGTAPWKPGRGLANMETRAASIGGTLTVTRAAEGTCVELVIPGDQDAGGSSTLPEASGASRAIVRDAET